jgi:subtilisin family serine protease
VTTDALPQGTVTWGLKDTRAADGDEPGFWKTFGVKGDGIVVANIDTGVQWNHPALVNQFKCPGNPTDATCWRDPSNICGAGGACDNNGHGTHTMGTMVAKDDPALPYTAGMAPSARWIACKGCESNSCSDLALNTCADWILQPGGSTANRPHIVNNSWGGDGGDNWYLDKVQAWRAAGIFPAFSAGNSGSGCSTLGSPGDYQESFGSAAHGESRTIASFSSRGPGAFGHDPYTKPNISAPGVGVISTLPGNAWGSLNGTSMASPHTAGAVALLWSCNPGLRGQIDPTAELLQNTADAAPAGSCGAPPDGQGNYTYGYGYLNVLAAGNIACGGGASPMLRVKDITLVPSCRLRKVIANIGVVDQDDLAVSQATVSVKWIQPDGTTTAQKDTNASGKALFLKSAQPGVHNLCVENLTKSGYGYGKVEDCKKIEYQCQ